MAAETRTHRADDRHISSETRPSYDSDLARKAGLATRKPRMMKGRGHPTTADIDYTEQEMEFLYAIQEFKRVSGRQFPTWSEALGVVRKLGYSKDVA